MKTTATATAPPTRATPPSSNGFRPSTGAREPPLVVLDAVDVEAIDVLVLVALVLLEVDVSADVVDLPVVVVVKLLVVVDVILLVVEEVDALLVVVAVELVLLVVVVEVVLVVVDDVKVLEVVVVVVDTLTKLPKTAIGVTPPGGYALILPQSTTLLPVAFAL